MATNDDDQHYVYVYRDPGTYDVRYVGRGKEVKRSLKHLSGSHNDRLNDFIERLEKRNLSPVVEFVGPFGELSTAVAVEAALISSYWNDDIFNKRQESKEMFFRSASLPKHLTTRQYQEPLSRKEVAANGGALVVYVNAKDLGGGTRPGAKPTLKVEESDDAIRERVVRYWQIGKDVAKWKQGKPPKYLLALTGPTTRRWVYAAVEIKHNGWPDEAPFEGGLWQVPVKTPAKNALDAGKFRGRIAKPGDFGKKEKASGQRRFNAFRQTAFDVIPPTRSR